MNRYQILKKIRAILALLGLVFFIYLLWARPYQLRWGATQAEIGQPMPGDELDTHPTFLATRAITIDATPREIWPWLVQMGYERAGFYGYDIIENLGSRQGPQSAERIVPELQNVKVGDEIPISAVGSWRLYAIELEHYFIWSGMTGDGGFTWALYPIDEHHTRLVSRIRWSHHYSPPSQLALDVFTEFTDHLAVRKILQGVKGRVEGHIESTTQTNMEFAIYVAAALIFFVAIVLLIVRPLTWGRWLAGLAAGAVWLIIWYAPVSIWIGSLLEFLVLWGLRQAFRASGNSLSSPNSQSACS
ncbi:hypothetical protein ANRL4_02973 [Anaerolineae bacterium]|nr:hypothetical protein ANRL4_02973 [Anaerolineae bacterium]